MTDSEAAARRLGLEKSEEGYALTASSLLSGIGGIQGVLETVLPSFAFLVAFAITQQAIVSVSVAASCSLIFILLRVFQRKNLLQAMVGAAAVGLAAFLALREGGTAADYFVPGFYTNLAYGSVLALSALIKYPILGFVGGLLFGLSNWRTNSKLRKRFSMLTWVWVGFFSLRLAIQVPLYWAGEIELLATSRIVMGAPAYAGLLALTWVLMRRIASAPSGRLEEVTPREQR